MAGVHSRRAAGDSVPVRHRPMQTAAKAARLSVKDLSWTPGGGNQALLKPLSFDLEAGATLGIVGPNGAGKTSLLRLLYRFNRPSTGQVLVGGDDIWSLSARQVAQRVSVVLQEQPGDFALTVKDIVALGRTPHRRGFAGASGATGGARDDSIIDAALDRLNLSGFGLRSLATLSGGERQRVLVARALAQEPRLLILDEPTNHLDIRHQLEIIDLIRDLPITIVASLHDLNLAAGVCDQVLLLDQGAVKGFGPPEQVLTETAVSQAFQVGTQSETLSLSNTKHLTFHLENHGVTP